VFLILSLRTIDIGSRCLALSAEDRGEVAFHVACYLNFCIKLRRDSCRCLIEISVLMP